MDSISGFDPEGMGSIPVIPFAELTDWLCGWLQTSLCRFDSYALLMGGWSNGMTRALDARDEGSIPSPPTYLRGLVDKDTWL